MNYCKKKKEKCEQFEPLSRIILYNDPSTPNLNLQKIKDYLKTKLNNVDIILRDEFLSYHIQMIENNSSYISRLTWKLANTKVRDYYDFQNRIHPLKGEIDIEKKLILNPTKAIPGIFYDGIRLNEIFQELMKANEIDRNNCHIIITSRFFGTFDEFDKRYHARVILCSYPIMISTSGIVEAPAKPKVYYKIKQALLQQNIQTIEEFIPEELKGKYLIYNDSRITEILKGYVMQGIFFDLTSEPFCSNLQCRLYNAHWQEELLQAQLLDPEFCLKHERLLEQINNR